MFMTRSSSEVSRLSAVLPSGPGESKSQRFEKQEHKTFRKGLKSLDIFGYDMPVRKSLCFQPQPF